MMLEMVQNDAGVEKPKVRISTFGGLRVSSATHTIEAFDTKKVRTLLARLVLSSRPLPRESLAAFLWPDDFEDSTRPRLRTELYRLKTILAPFGDLLLVTRDSVGLDHSACTTDIDDFQRNLRKARIVESDDEILAAFATAFAAAQGEWLPHESDDWFYGERNSLREAQAKALREASEIAERTGSPDLALTYAKQAIALEPTHSEIALRLIEAFGAARDVAGGIAAFELYCERLETELQLKPDPRVKAKVDELRSGVIRPEVKSGASVVAPIPAITLFPPLPTLGAALIGREASLDNLMALLLPSMSEMRRFVSVLGSGGMGKTTLALAVARELQSDYRGRVSFVDLSSTFDGGQMMLDILSAIGIKETSEPFEAIARQLGSKPALLVLDNLEQIPDAGKVISTLLNQLPGLRILATSRRAIGLEDEQRYPLEPFVTPFFIGSKEDYESMAAVKLYLDRVRRRLPQYDPSEKELRTIVRLVERLDGLPLAIVLAASRGHVLSPSDMLSEMDAGPSWLENEASSTQARHRGIAHTFAWSMDQLDASSRKHLVELSIFEGGWTLQAARHVCGSDVLDSLTQLVDHSLVMRTTDSPGVRYSVLPLFMEFLRSQPESKTEELKERLANWALWLMRDASEDREHNLSDYISRLSSETANLEKTLTWLEANDPQTYTEALSLIWPLWQTKLTTRRGVERLASWSNKGPIGDEGLIADCQYGMAMLLNYQGRYEEAEGYAEAAAARFTALGDTKNLLKTTRALSHVAYYRFQFSEMERLTRDSIRIGTEIDDIPSVAAAYSNLGLALANLDRGEEALDAFDNSIRIRDGLGDAARALSARHLMATALLSMRRWENARAVLEGVMREAEESNDRMLMAHCHTHLATVGIRTGDYIDARNRLLFADDLAGPEADPFSVGVRRYLSTNIAVFDRNYNVALDHALLVIDSWHTKRSELSVLPGIDLVAYVLASMGQKAQAQYLLDSTALVRKKHGINESPHYRITRELALAIIESTEPQPTPIDDLTNLVETTRRIIRTARMDNFAKV